MSAELFQRFYFIINYMYFRNTCYYLLLYKQIFCNFHKMPFYAVIFRTSKTGSVADNWDMARGLRDSTPNSYAKKFFTKTDAEKYIKDFNFKIIQKVVKSNNDCKSVKRKLPEDSNNLMISSVKNHIQNIKMAFNNLQVLVASHPGSSNSCVDQIKILSCDVNDKLNKILNVNETESNDNISSSITNKCLEFSNRKNPSSTSNLDVTDSITLLPSEIEAAKKSLTFNEKNEVIVYTDGACSHNGYNNASAGAGVWFGNRHPLNLSIKVPGAQTNNNAEIFSIIKAIELVKAIGLTKVNIHTDSEFVIKSVNEWMPRWQTNGWKTSTGSEVKNKEMFMLLYKQIKSLDLVNWTHVNGHSGIIGNEEADKLARIGAKM